MVKVKDSLSSEISPENQDLGQFVTYQGKKNNAAELVY